MSPHQALGPLVETKADGSQKTIFAIIRDAARRCSNVEYRDSMEVACQKLAFLIDALADNATTHNMQAVTAAWANAVRIYENRPPEADPNPPLAGAPEAARLAA